MDSKTLVKLVIIDIMIKNIVIMWVILIRQYFYSYLLPSFYTRRLTFGNVM